MCFFFNLQVSELEGQTGDGEKVSELEDEVTTLNERVHALQRDNNYKDQVMLATWEDYVMFLYSTDLKYIEYETFLVLGFFRVSWTTILISLTIFCFYTALTASISSVTDKAAHHMASGSFNTLVCLPVMSCNCL